jgi:hypothetical protein
LVALALALWLQPSEVYCDSLTSLQIVRGWGTWSAARMLSCDDRVEVRQFIAEALSSAAPPPTLVKVKAHDDHGLALGHPMAVGNDLADQWAKLAAGDPTIVQWRPAHALHGDPVELRNAADDLVGSAAAAFAPAWWQRCSPSTSSRAWLRLLYPADVAIDWPSSTGIFRRPVTSGGTFVHAVAPAVIKWVARLRTGSLNTRLRVYTRLRQGSPACGCCDATEEDDEHAISGCPGTGTSDWPAIIMECWAAAARSIGKAVPPPAPEWLALHHLQLLAALIPSSLAAHATLPPADVPRFCQRLHRELAIALADRLFRRQATLSAAPSPAALSPASASAARPGVGLQRPCPLPPDRQLSPQALRRLEVQRRAAAAAPSPSPPAVTDTAPPSGEHRRVWLRRRLERLLLEDTVPCPASMGSTALVFLELFERITHEVFTEAPGQPVTSRVRAIAKVLGNICREVTFTPTLVTGRRVVHRGAFVVWSRRPIVAADVDAWRRRLEAREAYQVPSTKTRVIMSAADAGLAAWLREHRHLRPVEVDQGESGMALLLLWEVDHAQSYPSLGGATTTAMLLAFTRRLKRRVAADKELSAWLTMRDMHGALAPGLAPSHHARWSVAVVPPGPAEPQGWYDEFRHRWLAYLASQAHPTGAQPAAPLALPLLGAPPAPPAESTDVATSSNAVGAPPTARARCSQPPPASSHSRKPPQEAEDCGRNDCAVPSLTARSCPAAANRPCDSPNSSPRRPR